MSLLKKLFGKKEEPRQEVKAESKPRRRKILVAWSQKYPGEKSILSELKPYEGLSAAELKKAVKTRTVFEYPRDYSGDDVYFKKEPTNEYNPNAIEIYSENHGKLGYVPDKNLKYIEGVMDKIDQYDIKWVLQGGGAKFYDDLEKEIIEDESPAKIIITIVKK